MDALCQPDFAKEEIQEIDLLQDDTFISNYSNAMHASAGDFEIGPFLENYPPPNISIAGVADPPLK